MRYAMLVIALLGVAAGARAQATIPAGMAGGLTGGLIASHGSLATLGLRAYGMRPGAVSGGFALDLPPAVIGDAVILLSDLSVTYTVAAPGMSVVFRAGPSAVVGFDRAIAGFVGAHAGTAIIMRVGRHVGLVMDITPKAFIVDGETHFLVSMGLGVLAIPAAP